MHGHTAVQLQYHLAEVSAHNSSSSSSGNNDNSSSSSSNVPGTAWLHYPTICMCVNAYSDSSSSVQRLLSVCLLDVVAQIIQEGS
jgi:hypothetical protein